MFFYKIFFNIFSLQTLKSSVNNYERLEFLGDSLLKFLVSAQLFYEDLQADESVLSSRREDLINNQFLALKSKKFKLGNFMKFDYLKWIPSGMFDLSSLKGNV